MGTLQIFPRLGSWPQKHVEPCLGQTQYICGPCVPAVLLADSLWSQVTAGAIPLKDTVGVGQFFCVAAGLSLEVTRKSIFFFLAALREEFHPQICQKQKELPGEAGSSLLLEVCEQMLENCLATLPKVFPAIRASEAVRNFPGL